MRVSWSIALAGLLIASGCARSGGAQPADSVVPFAAVVAAAEAARYADYAGLPGVAVRDEAAFEEMRRYLVLRYHAADVTRSVASGGAVFDCHRQTQAGSARQSPGMCPDGSVPVRRVTLDDLTRFPTLAAFLAKGPGLP